MRPHPQHPQHFFFNPSPVYFILKDQRDSKMKSTFTFHFPCTHSPFLKLVNSTFEPELLMLRIVCLPPLTRFDWSLGMLTYSSL